MAYLSFIEQTMHYFDRPHQSVCIEPVACPAAWRGAELPPLEELAYRLKPAEVEEVCRAVDHAAALAKPTKELTREDFPLSLLANRTADWRSQLAGGLGFQVVRDNGLHFLFAQAFGGTFCMYVPEVDVAFAMTV